MRRSVCRALGCVLTAGAAGCMPGVSVVSNEDVQGIMRPFRCAETWDCAPWQWSPAVAGLLLAELQSPPIPSAELCVLNGTATPGSRDVGAAVVTTIYMWSGTPTTVLGVRTLDGQSHAHRNELGIESLDVAFPQLPEKKPRAGARLEAGAFIDEAFAACSYVSVGSGEHVATLQAVTWEQGRRTCSSAGTAQFVATPGGFYSFQVCRQHASGKLVFWVRDEGSRTCVSRVCPRVQ